MRLDANEVRGLAKGDPVMSKKAFLVGINNFTRPDWQLNGCINDTVAVRELLQSYFDFQDDDIKVIHDRDATAQGIRDGLGWLLQNARSGDVRIFHFSSHGTQVPDESDDEMDVQDEVIVPFDHDWSKPFRDDDLRAIFDTIPDGVNFTFIADCCHSGSIQKGLLDSGIEFKPRYLTPGSRRKIAIRKHSLPGSPRILNPPALDTAITTERITRSP